MVHLMHEPCQHTLTNRDTMRLTHSFTPKPTLTLWATDTGFLAIFCQHWKKPPKYSKKRPQNSSTFSFYALMRSSIVSESFLIGSGELPDTWEIISTKDKQIATMVECFWCILIDNFIDVSIQPLLHRINLRRLLSPPSIHT